MSGFPDKYFLMRKQTEKMRQTTWFHVVTSQMTYAQVVIACVQHGFGVEGQTLRDLQTKLLGAVTHRDGQLCHICQSSPHKADRKALASVSIDAIATFNPMHYS
jgi:hypothetical protein